MGEPCDTRAADQERSLLSALEALAKATGYHLVTIPELVKGERVVWQPDCSSPTPSLEKMASQLLAPNRLAYRVINDTLVVYRAEPTQTKTAPPAPVPAPSIAEVSVEASPYVAQPATGSGNQFGRYQGSADAVLDYERIHSLGITDLASALELISGVKLEQERYAVIRGMKGRYQSVRLNGATIPSLEPSGQRVPLDVFPVNILNQVDLRKSVFADAPGNASAGVVNIETRRIPETPYLTLVSGGGYRSGTTGSPVIRGYTGGHDWLGYDDGGRALPKVLAQNARLGSPDDWEAAQRKAAGEAILNSADGARNPGIYHGTAGADGLLSLSGGRAWQRGRHHWGLTGSLGYQNTWQQRALLSQVLNRFSVAADEGEGGAGSLYATEEGHHRRLENVINLNALLALGYGLDERHQLGSNFLLLRQSVNRAEQIETRERDGFGDYAGSGSLRSLSNWTETQMALWQFYGHHFIGPEERIALNWHLTSAQSRYTRPFDVRYRYRRNSLFDSYYFEPGYNQFEVSWEEMREETLSAGVSGAYLWEWGENWSGELKSGLELLKARQDGYLLEYTFIAKGNIEQDRERMAQTNPMDILTSEMILGAPGGDGFLLDDDLKLIVSPPELDGSFYAAQHRNHASYVLADTRFDERWQLVLGVRRERDGVDADFWDAQPQAWVPLMDGTQSLYSAALGYVPDPPAQQELHLGYSETAVWPGVNELMPRRYEDTDLRIEISGNPNLQMAAAQNWDLRWRYRNDLLGLDMKLLGFYKTIDNPIEGVFFDPVINNSHAFNIYSYANSSSARLYGVEWELDYQRVFADSHRLVLQSSYASMVSDVTIPSGHWREGRSRPLQGQPAYLGSLQLQYRHLGSERGVSLLYKRAGRELEIVSNNRNVPDVYRDPHDSLALIVNTPVLDGMYATLSVENLLDDTRRYSQGEETFMAYQSGRRYQLRLGVEF